MATCSEEDPKNKPQPQLMKLDRAFKLAEQWVNNMSKSSVDRKSISLDLEGRPSRLGIGASVPKASRTTISDNPVEKKLIATLNAGKKKIFTGDETPSTKGENGGEDSDEDESESKTRSFTKKRPPSFSHLLLHSKKKHK